MKKIFPNIETAIIFVFLIIVMLWGVSKCNKKKVEVSATLPGTESMSYDSLGSPAARSAGEKPTTALPQPTAIPPTTITATPPQYAATITTPPPTTPAQTIQQQPIQPTTTISATPPKTPTAPAVTVVPSANQNVQPTVTSSGTSLYVLQNGLNVRTKPDLKAKSLGKLKLHDQVFFLDEVTETVETVRLIDGTEITKPWFKIKTKRGTIGWVHGSGVDFYKRKPKDGQ